VVLYWQVTGLGDVMKEDAQMQEMSKPDRDLNSVLYVILKHIPDDFVYKKSMVRRFSFVCESIPYTAPEAMYLRWGQCYEILEDYIPEPTLDWQKTIAKIFSAEIDYLGCLS